MQCIGSRLRELRKRENLSQTKVAAIVGSNQSTVARYESGNTHVPANIVIKYADYFKVSLDYIYGRIDQPQDKLYDTNHTDRIG